MSQREVAKVAVGMAFTGDTFDVVVTRGISCSDLCHNVGLVLADTCGASNLVCQHICGESIVPWTSDDIFAEIFHERVLTMVRLHDIGA